MNKRPLKIYTLGSFEILKDGRKVQFSRKIPKKPLTMLKALIALGGKGVTKSGASDILWPVAEGDATHRAFITTLSRLRQLIGMDKAILFQDGLMTLNPRYCWVDLWSFEKLLHVADNAAKEGYIEKHFSCLVKAIKIYQGDFLTGDIEEPWTFSLREQLRDKFIRSIVKLGSHWEETRQFEKAIDCYSKGLEVCDLAEELYQRLMVCYCKLGLNADVVGIYKRLKKVLSIASGITPSPKTEQIFKDLVYK